MQSLACTRQGRPGSTRDRAWHDLIVKIHAEPREVDCKAFGDIAAQARFPIGAGLWPQIDRRPGRVVDGIFHARRRETFMHAHIGGKARADLVRDAKARNPFLDLILATHGACWIEAVHALKINRFIANARRQRPRPDTGLGGDKA